MVSQYLDIQLLRLAWKNSLYDVESLITTDGKSVKVVVPGEYEPAYGLFCGAEIVIDGIRTRGDVKVCDLPERDGGLNNERTILHIVPEPLWRLRLSNGELVPQVVLPVKEELVREYAGLRKKGCIGKLKGEDPLLITSLFTRLLVERLERKCGDVMNIHAASHGSWNETMYVMLFRSLGDNRNKEAFTSLARAVPFSVIARERNSVISLEALLLGGAGLLERREEDDYIVKLKEEFDHLRRKHNIVPLRTIVWNLSSINPYNAPVLRIAQLSAFLSSNDFFFERLTLCRTPDDIVNFFAIDASEYWTTHFTPSRLSFHSPKKIGTAKAHLMGINFVAPLMFAYGRSEGDEELCERAISILENIPAEDNTIIAKWRASGLNISSAFDTQAILQLNNVYCTEGRCGECYYGKNVLVSLYRHGRK